MKKILGRQMALALTVAMIFSNLSGLHAFAETAAELPLLPPVRTETMQRAENTATGSSATPSSAGTEEEKELRDGEVEAPAAVASRSQLEVRRTDHTITAFFSGYIFSVSGNLPEDAVLSVKELTDTDKLKDLIADSQGGKEYVVQKAWDISVLSGGELYEPEAFGERVRVTIGNLSDEAAGKNTEIFHIKHETEVEKIHDAVLDGDKAEFSMGSFSPVLLTMPAGAPLSPVSYALYFDVAGGKLLQNDSSGPEVTVSGMTTLPGKLTMENVNFTTTASKALIIEKDAAIELNGTNTLQAGNVSGSEAREESYGISAIVSGGSEPAITFSGAGSLTVLSGSAETTYGAGGFANTYGIMAGQLSFSGSGDLKFLGGNANGHEGTGWSYGIGAKKITLSSGTVSGTGQDGSGTTYSGSTGIFVYDDSGFLNVTGGTMTAQGTEAMHLSSAYGAPMTIVGGTVAATGKLDGIDVCGNITVKSGGMLSVSGEESGTAGIYFCSNMEASGSGKIRVTGPVAVEECTALIGDANGSTVYNDTGILSPAEYRYPGFYIGSDQVKTLEITKYTGAGWIVALDAGIGYGSLAKYSYKTDAAGKLTEALPVPTSSYGVFDGWFTDQTWSTAVTEATVFTAHTTIYAKYLQYGLVILDPNGGSVPETSYYFDTAGKLLLPLPVPTRAGYGFSGWYDAAAGGNRYTDSSIFTENKVLFAHWTSNSGSSGGGGGGNRGAGGSVTGPEGNRPTASSGSWNRKEDGSWEFILTGGDKKKNGWAYVGNNWYHFDGDGKLSTGWVQGADGWYLTNRTAGTEEGRLLHGWQQDPDGNWYYLNPETGRMLVGWVKSPASGKWYYLNTATQENSGTPNGAMLAGGTTPDGYLLNPDGSWKE